MASDDDVDAVAFRAHALEIVGSWSVHNDDDGHLFYYNLESGESRWHAPDELRALESACMMKLMVDGALARSGTWTVHDTGDGTMYYFNEKTRESVWERPEQWGVEAVVAGNGEAVVPPPPPPPGQSKKSEPTKKKELKPKKKKKERVVEKEEDTKERPEEAPLSATDLETLRQRAEDVQKSRDSFRDMLRDKKIMPFCKWSVAFPQIASDPRFLAVSTMDERLEIFEDYVKHRPRDLKSDKKSKLKEAKKKLSKSVREQLKQQRERGVFDEKLTLSVWLATLEHDMAPDQYKSLQQEVLAFLPLAVQEKLWQKEMTDFLEATKDERAMETQLKAFLLEKLADRGSYVSWHDGVVQDAVQTFITTHTSTQLPESIQQAVVVQVAKALSLRATADAKRQAPTTVPQHRESTSQPTSEARVARRVSPSRNSGLDDHHRPEESRRPPSRSPSRDRHRDHERGRRERRDSGSRRSRRHGHSSSRSRSRSRDHRRERERDRSQGRRSSHHDRSRRSRSASHSRSSSRSSSRDRHHRRR